MERKFLYIIKSVARNEDYFTCTLTEEKEEEYFTKKEFRKK